MVRGPDQAVTRLLEGLNDRIAGLRETTESTQSGTGLRRPRLSNASGSIPSGKDAPFAGCTGDLVMQVSTLLSPDGFRGPSYEAFRQEAF